MASVPYAMVTDTRIPSANMDAKECKRLLSKSVTIIINDTEPRTVPCYTLESTGKGGDKALFPENCWVLFERKP